MPQCSAKCYTAAKLLSAAPNKDKLFVFKIKCEERPKTQQKVDRINRVGNDLCETLDGASKKAIGQDVQKLNDRWKDVSPALESFSDKEYPENDECCFLRIIKRKFKSLS